MRSQRLLWSPTRGSNRIVSLEIVTKATARKIDERVQRLLRDVDASEPPLNLDDVRSLLKLDRGYYSADDTDLLRDVLHKLNIGAQQVLVRPTRILDAVRERKLRALWVPEKRKILIDESLHELQKRWAEGHETIHSIIKHHSVLTLGDPEHTLSSSCLERIEAEANFGAGRLLYFGDMYLERLLSGEIELDRIRTLAHEFGNSMKSSLWRAVESLNCAACGVLSVHPWEQGVEKDKRVDHFIRSELFRNQFARVTEDEVFRKLAKVVHRRGNGSIGDKDVVLTDIGGADHVFRFECFATKYGVMSFGRCLAPRPTVVRM